MRYKIILTTVQDVCEFVKKMSRYPFDIDLYYGHIVLDAKSIMGVLAVGLNKQMELCVHADRTTVFEHEIGQYMCLCA
ncbi:HPr family phosphocarrier protein [Clostridium transplantifaecale]|uniref:HPr family phosphocarrier protein n=1 Tax=Clostridium transplantifaecale TaxID=2479838 RepID=UPI000F63C718|nr:HPr family phosphocarrier protein [Clostridium transplantifaecale]